MKMHLEPVSLPHPNRLLAMELLDYSNPYDFQRPHRHDYFELIFVTEGAGQQQIDFKGYEMQGGQLFTIYPGQVHLMQRGTAKGLIIQFRKTIFQFITPLKHYRLFFPNSVFKLSSDEFGHLYDLSLRMMALLEKYLSSTDKCNTWAILLAGARPRKEDEFWLIFVFAYDYKNETATHPGTKVYYCHTPERRLL